MEGDGEMAGEAIHTASALAAASASTGPSASRPRESASSLRDPSKVYFVMNHRKSDSENDGEMHTKTECYISSGDALDVDSIDLLRAHRRRQPQPEPFPEEALSDGNDEGLVDEREKALCDGIDPPAPASAMAPDKGGKRAAGQAGVSVLHQDPIVDELAGRWIYKGGPDHSSDDLSQMSGLTWATTGTGTGTVRSRPGPSGGLDMVESGVQYSQGFSQGYLAGLRAGRDSEKISQAANMDDTGLAKAVAGVNTDLMDQMVDMFSHDCSSDRAVRFSLEETGALRPYQSERSINNHTGVRRGKGRRSAAASEGARERTEIASVKRGSYL